MSLLLMRKRTLRDIWKLIQDLKTQVSRWCKPGCFVQHDCPVVISLVGMNAYLEPMWSWRQGEVWFLLCLSTGQSSLASKLLWTTSREGKWVWERGELFSQFLGTPKGRSQARKGEMSWWHHETKLAQGSRTERETSASAYWPYTDANIYWLFNDANIYWVINDMPGSVLSLQLNYFT